MTASQQRLKNRQREKEKREQKNNEKKRKNLDKIRNNVQYDKRGRQKKTKPNLISNIGKNADYGQRAAKLKESLGGIGSMENYKKTEKEAFKKADKYVKNKEKENKKKLKVKDKGKVSRKGTNVMKKFIRHNGKIIKKSSVAGRELMKKLKIRK